jgi:chemotaxis methyl-accepting protein methylase
MKKMRTSPLRLIEHLLLQVLLELVRLPPEFKRLRLLNFPHFRKKKIRRFKFWEIMAGEGQERYVFADTL